MALRRIVHCSHRDAKRILHTLVPNYLERFLFRDVTKTLPFWNAYNLSLTCVEFLLNSVFQWRLNSALWETSVSIATNKSPHLSFRSLIGPYALQNHIHGIHCLILIYCRLILHTKCWVMHLLKFPILRTFLWQICHRPIPTFHCSALLKRILVLKNAVVWRVTPCSLVEVYSLFRIEECVRQPARIKQQA